MKIYFLNNNALLSQYSLDLHDLCAFSAKRFIQIFTLFCTNFNCGMEDSVNLFSRFCLNNLTRFNVRPKIEIFQSFTVSYLTLLRLNIRWSTMGISLDGLNILLWRWCGGNSLEGGGASSHTALIITNQSIVLTSNMWRRRSQFHSPSANQLFLVSCPLNIVLDNFKGWLATSKAWWSDIDCGGGIWHAFAQ